MNKKLFIAFLALPILIMSAFTPAQNPTPKPELKWYGWNEGYAKAVKEGKIVLIDAYTDWCGWCKKMDRDTYTNPEIIKKINEHFVPIKFNPEIKDVTYNIGDKTFKPEELYYMLTNGNATGFPTTYFIFTKKMSLFLEPGYKDSASFNTLLDAAIAESKK
ncbi:MAG: thioredoxin family protein [Bacteroidia bacterium]|jgi:uncharacterized protein YyaL (SSP411 family)